MDAQMERAHGHRYDQDPLHPRSPVEGEGDHHEKKSVMNKVKAKAKKIKHTLGIKGHGHDEHEHDNNDEEDEYEEDEKPETHGAPRYDEAPAAKNLGTGQDGTGVQPRTNLGPTSQLGQGHEQNVCPGTFQSKVAEPGVPAAAPKYDSGAQRNVGTDHNVNPVNPGQFKGTSGQQDYREDISSTNYQTKGSDFGKGVESAAPRHPTDQGDSAGQFKDTLGKPLDVDQNAPKNRPQDVSPANYGTKATNSAGTGTEEAGVAPILKSFGKMDIHDEPQHKKEPTTTGSHDHFSPKSTIPESYNASTENQPQDINVDERAKTISAKKEPATTGSHDQFSPTADSSSDKTSTIPENTPVPESVNASTENHPQDMNVDEPAKQRSGYMGTFSSVTSALTDKATSAKNIVASKIGYGGTKGNVTGSQMNKEGEDVVSAGVPMASTELARGPAGQQSSYTDKISSAASAFAGKAISAKNVAASKLGYGENNNPSSPTASEMSKGTSTSPTAAEMNTGGENAQSGGATGYGRQIASTAADKLAPVYGTVAGVGSAVMSKLPGTGTNKNAGTDSDTNTITGSDMDRGAGVPVETGSGAGVKGYITEKLKPGEEDKALSEVISGAFFKRGKGVDEEKRAMGEVASDGGKGIDEEKRAMGEVASDGLRGKGVDKEEKRAMGEVVSDAFHKRDNDDEMKVENKPMGKVTESEEVANRLGSSESEKLGKVPTSETSPRTGALDKVKGALTNWFGKGGETNPSQAFNDNSPSEASGKKQDISTFGSNNDDSQDGERRLQESTN